MSYKGGTCGTCGVEHVAGLCNGHKKQARGGGQCRRTAGHGTDHLGYGNCIFHLGSTPNGKLAASREHAAQAMATLGLPVTVDPASAMCEEIARTNGHVLWLAAQVADLEEKDLVWGVVESQDGSGAAGSYTREASKPSVWYALYLQERQHLARVVKMALDAGLAERQVRLAEQQGALLADVLRAVLGDPTLGLTDAQRQAMPGVLRRHLAVVRAS